MLLRYTLSRNFWLLLLLLNHLRNHFFLLLLLLLLLNVVLIDLFLLIDSTEIRLLDSRPLTD